MRSADISGDTRFSWGFGNMEIEYVCPACGKPGKSRQSILLHFRKALEGWDPIWNRNMPHSNWAKARGLKVQEGGYFLDGEAIKRVLYDNFDGQQR